MKTATPAISVLDEVTTWPGISTRTTSRGATAIVFDGHELGHVRRSRGTLDMPLPEDRRAAVLNAAQAKDWFPGWVSKPLANDADARDGIALLRQSYDELHNR
jgi:Luciferase